MSVAACGISSTQDTDVALLIRATGQNIWPDGQITKNLSSPSEENIPLRRHPKSPLQLAPSRPGRGALAIVTNVGAGRGGRGSVGRVVVFAGRPSVRERTQRADDRRQYPA